MKRLLSLILLILSVAVIQAQEQPNPCEPDPEKTFSTWEAHDDQCTQQQEINLSISLSYPQELTAYPTAMEAISGYLNQVKSDFLTTAFEFAGDFIPTASYPWTLEITYTEEEFSDSVVSVLFYLWTFTGGAHGSHLTTTFTFDLATDTQLTLPDLFVEGTDVYGVLAPLAQADLIQQMQDMTGEAEYDAAWVEEGTAPTPENYQAFALTPDSLILVFQEYQVAPYVFGSFQVEIPLSDLQAVLKPEFQPAS